MKRFFPFLIVLLLVSCQQPKHPVSLTILHTNDTHSQVEPLTSGVNIGRGGYARRMGMIDKLRQEDPELLLLDAGDYWQGSPYFNFFNGRIEIDALNRMGYDAATLGNHEFDNGVDTLAKVLREANFPIVCANYAVEGTPLEDIVKPFVIFRRKGLKIGVIGLGVNPKSLITEKNFTPLKYIEPISVANRLADQLKNREHCDVVLCLSHLGTDTIVGMNNPASDRILAQQSENIDLIIGGHTHKVINEYENNRLGRPVLLVQTGKSGVNLGKITLQVE